MTVSGGLPGPRLSASAWTWSATVLDVGRGLGGDEHLARVGAAVDVDPPGARADVEERDSARRASPT